MKHPKYYVRIKDDGTIATMCLWRMNVDSALQISINAPNNWTSSDLDIQYCIKNKSIKYIPKREAKSLFPEAFK